MTEEHRQHFSETLALPIIQKRDFIAANPSGWHASECPPCVFKDVANALNEVADNIAGHDKEAELSCAKFVAGKKLSKRITDHGHAKKQRRAGYNDPGELIE